MIDKASRAWNFYPIWWFSNCVELRCDNENCFTIKFQEQSPKYKISETSQVNEIVKNTQLSLSHSSTIVLSVCRCRGITNCIECNCIECKITETVVTSVSTLCNEIFKIGKTSRAWNFYPIGWFFNSVVLRCDNENCFTIKFQVLNTWVYSSGPSIYMCWEKVDKEINISFNSLCKKLWSLPKPSKIE